MMTSSVVKLCFEDTASFKMNVLQPVTSKLGNLWHYQANEYNFKGTLINLVMTSSFAVCHKNTFRITLTFEHER